MLLKLVRFSSHELSLKFKIVNYELEQVHIYLPELNYELVHIYLPELNNELVLLKCERAQRCKTY